MSNFRASSSIDAMLSRTIENENGCLIWQGSKNKSGYGYAAFGEPGPKRRPHLAHRIVCILVYGEPQPGQFALHSCDQPSCINPHHLRWGSPKENVKDMISRNRGNFNKKLTNEQVIEIRLLREQGSSLATIADLYGICFQNVSQICLKKTYKNLEGLLP